MLRTRRKGSRNGSGGNGSGRLRRLRLRLAEAEETLDAIRKGEVDAITVEGPHGRQIFTLQSADLPYRTLVERMNEGAASMNEEGVILFCNERLAEMLGAHAEKLIGRSILALVVPGEREALEQLLARGLQDEARGEISLQSDEGAFVPVSLSLKATPGTAQGERGVCLVATDVSERRRAEGIAAAEREKFNRILDNLPPYVVLITPDYHVAFANREFRQRFGESHGRRCYEFLFERSEPCEVCNTYEVLKTGGPVNWKWTGPDGRNYDIYDFPFTDTDGSWLILEMGVDVTEQKRAEEALRTASQYARKLIEASPDPLVTISSDGKITDVNQATEAATGASREQLVGSDFSDYFTEPDKAREVYRKVFEYGAVRDYPLAIRHASGRVTDVLYNATVYKNEAGQVQGVFAAARDVTERKRGEQKLREQAALLDLAHDATVLRGLDGRIVFWSRGAGDTYGFSAEEAIGKVSHDLLQTVFPTALEDIRQRIEEAREWEGELRHTRRDGARIVVASRRSLLRDEQGKPAAIMEINRDITLRKRAEEERRAASLYARRLIEASLDPLVTISSRGKITDVNHAAETATGLPREQLVGSDFSDYFTEPEKARQGYQEAFQQGTVRDYPLALRHTSGRVTDVLYNASVYKNEAGEVQGVFAAARDVTARKAAEAALEEKAQELARSNEELAQFAYVASHDLQEPLRKIVAFGDRLAAHSEAVLDEQGRDYLQRMQNAAKRMGQLIESLLDLSRVTTKGAQFAAVDLNAVLSEVLADLEVRIQQTAGRVDVEPLPTVTADHSQMRQLFQNLIGNALKFHQENIAPAIRIHAEYRDGAWEIHVADNGIGFDEKYTDRIFRPFQRLHGKNVFEGSGMGLAICSKIAARHAGQITAHSEPGRGSEFVLTLPAKPRMK